MVNESDGYKDDELDELEDDPEEAYRVRATAAMARSPEEDDRPVQAGGGGGSLSEKIESRPDWSDMQTAFFQLFPEDLGTRVTNKLMVARIEPSAFLSLNDLLSTNEMMVSDPEKDIDVTEIRARNYTLTSIGLRGEGRIDAAELAGAAREDKKFIDKLKSLD